MTDEEERMRNRFLSDVEVSDRLYIKDGEVAGKVLLANEETGRVQGASAADVFRFSGFAVTRTYLLERDTPYIITDEGDEPEPSPTPIPGGEVML